MQPHPRNVASHLAALQIKGNCWCCLKENTPQELLSRCYTKIGHCTGLEYFNYIHIQQVGMSQEAVSHFRIVPRFVSVSLRVKNVWLVAFA